MNRARSSTLSFDAIEVEGAFLTPDMLNAVASLAAGEQTEARYDVPEGLTLRDEVGRYFRIAEALWARFDRVRARDAGGIAAREFMTGLLTKVLGFQIESVASLQVGDRQFPIPLLAQGGRFPIAIAPPAAAGPADERSALDRSLPRFGDSHRRRSATLMVQEALNVDERMLYGIVSDGQTLRLLRTNPSMTRPAWIEADLERILGQGIFAEFSALWLLLHGSRFGRHGDAPSDCTMERWREKGRAEGVTARKRLRVGVEEALRLLGEGFLQHRDNAALREALASGTLNSQNYFGEVLRTVYRFIFLFTAEDREVLHAPGAPEAARRLYAGGYAFARLRNKALRSVARDRNHDLYEGVRVAFRALERGEPRLGLPALGGLFLRDRTPNLNAARIENRFLLEAVEKLAFLRHEGARARVNWRDMETEEFGSVYESLLELTPRVDLAARTFVFVEAKGNARKTTGSYYTPDSLVQLLLDLTLDPVVEDALARAEPGREAEAILDLDVIDPACGSGHFLLAAARRLADRLALLRSPGAPSRDAYRHALRDVARHCLHGVDRNPMAVELCKVALWVETVEPGKPLGFLDNRVRQGDSLVGVFDYAALANGIPDEAYKALAGDDKAVTSELRKRNKKQRDGTSGQYRLGFAAPPGLAAAFAAVEAMPEDSVDEVRAKAAADRLARRGDWWSRKTACDLYVAAFFALKVAAEGRTRPLVPTTDDVWRAAEGHVADDQLLGTALALAAEIGAFHWPLEFPDVFVKGGFDVVVGNPPWDTMSPDVKEYFAKFDPAVRFMAPDEQKRRIEELLDPPGTRRAWDAYCRHLYLSANFLKESGRYRLFAEGNLGKGDFNVYRMFVELALRLARPAGRVAQFVPENLYNGANAAAIRRHLFEACRLHGLVGFENTGRVWFEIDTRAKFCLYVAAPSGATESFPAAFGINSKNKLTALRAGLPFDVPVALVHEFSPDALAVAEVAHTSDIAISRKLYARFPKFGGPVADLPRRSYARELDMGSDRDDFSGSADDRPIYEGRMVEAFDYRAKAWISGRGRAAVWRELPFGSLEKAICPQWRLAEADVPRKIGDRWRRYRVGFCDVASPTNQRAFVAALIPPEVICGHSVPTVEVDGASPELILLLLAVMNAFAVDFVAKKKVALHMSFTIVDSLPLPRAYTGRPVEREIARRALRLAATGPEMDPFWREVAPRLGLQGASPAEDVEERRKLRAELDVLVARDLYGLARDEMRYLLDPASILGPDPGFESFGALKRADERAFGGRFLTRDMILEAWDKLAAPGVVARLETTSLPDNAWTRRVGGDVRAQTLAQVAALLKSIPGPMPARTVRLAALYALEPRVLSAHLSGRDLSEWTRLVGSEASLADGSVSTLGPGGIAGWADAVRQLSATGTLVVDAAADTWAPGPGLGGYFTDGWPERAAFALWKAAERAADGAATLTSQETEGLATLAA